MAANVKKEVHTRRLALHGDGSGSRTGLAGQFDKLLFRAKREYPFSEQFQVIAAGSEGGISYHHLTTRPGEGEEGFQQEDLGQSVFGVGCRVENLVQYHMTGSEGSWISSASHVGTQGWSEMSVVLDTQSDTVNVGVRAYDDLTATLGSSVSILTGQSLGVNADAVTELRWDFRSGTLDTALSYKNYFDDFSFNVAPVPEPGSVLVVVLGSLMPIRRRKSAVK